MIRACKMARAAAGLRAYQLHPMAAYTDVGHACISIKHDYVPICM